MLHGLLVRPAAASFHWLVRWPARSLLRMLLGWCHRELLRDANERLTVVESDLAMREKELEISRKEVELLATIHETDVARWERMQAMFNRGKADQERAAAKMYGLEE